MNIIFLTVGRMESIEDHGIYPDLLRYFRDMGHRIYTVSPYEKRTGLKTQLIEEDGAKMLHVSIGNITKCGLIEKGVSTLQIESRFISAIKKYYGDVKFDLVMYSTPPITFAKVIRFIKKRDGARAYLMLKDIFPQNAVDLGMMTKSGPKSILYKFFRQKEKKLYAFSDHIGCMSPANADYVLKHNPEIAAEKVGLCPNCIDVVDMSLTKSERDAMREKYGIPLDKTVYVYGGNLGRPQGIPFIIECLKAQADNENAFFLIVGDGTEYVKLESYFADACPGNMKLMKRLPKDDYDRMIAACDVGLIFLDHRFTIPNFPSRLLAYMQAGLPVLACTDVNTDVGKVITDGGFGLWCRSDSVDDFCRAVNEMASADLSEMGEKALSYLCENYNSKVCYDAVMNSFDEEKI